MRFHLNHRTHPVHLAPGKSIGYSLYPRNYPEQLRGRIVHGLNLLVRVYKQDTLGGSHKAAQQRMKLLVEW